MWLAIDTSSSRASLAWIDPSQPERPTLWQRQIEAGRSHNTLIFEPLAEALQQPMAESLAGLVVGTGPGSYTGTRIGIAAALGIALQTSATPVYPWPSCGAMEPLEADAGETLPSSYLWLSDARRSRFALTLVEFGKLTNAPQLLDRNAALVWCKKLLQQGTVLCSSDDDPGSLAENLGLEPGSIMAVRPNAAILARAVATLSAAGLQELAREKPCPIYLAAPFVTTPKVPATRR